MLKYLFFLLCCLTSSCFFIEEKCQDINLEERINYLIQDKNSGLATIRLDTINSFEWNSLLVLQPYAQLDQAENRYGVSLSCVSKSIQSFDNIITISFLNNKECVSYIELYRTFRLIDEKKVLYEKSDALIEIEKYQNKVPNK